MLVSGEGSHRNRPFMPVVGADLTLPEPESAPEHMTSKAGSDKKSGGFSTMPYPDTSF